MQSVAVCLTLTFVYLSLAERVYYVKPAASSSEACPAQPCLLLNQYTANSSRYFTTGATFLFLPGNHTLSTSLHLTATANISLRAAETNPSVIITCTQSFTLENVTDLYIEGLTFLLRFAEREGTLEKELTVLVFQSCEAVLITNTVFRRDSVLASGRAIKSTDSNLTITDCLFKANAGAYGGAIFAENTVLNLVRNVFSRNVALYSGGAIHLEGSTVSLAGNSFSYNLGNSGGGAVNCLRCRQMNLTGHNDFHSNSAGVGYLSCGGAICMNDSSSGIFRISGSANFSNNTARQGGAIFLFHVAVVEIKSADIVFERNTAEYNGGALLYGFPSYTDYTSLTTSKDSNLTFISNSAKDMGPLEEACGAICIYNTKWGPAVNNISAILLNNSGVSGGAIYIQKSEAFTLHNIHAEYNKNGSFGIVFQCAVKFAGTNTFIGGIGAISILHNCSVTFTGNSTFHENSGRLGAVAVLFGSEAEFYGRSVFSNNQGGVLYANDYSSVSFHGETLFVGNTNSSGGAVFLEHSTLHLANSTIFVENEAQLYGGGIYASRSIIYMRNTVSFSRNSARSGGAMYLALNSTIELDNSTSLSTSDNWASEYGGAIFNKDAVSSIQCENVATVFRTDPGLSLTIPASFLQVMSSGGKQACPQISSFNDSAGKDGNFLYGGLLDRSRLRDVRTSLPYNYLTSVCNAHVSSHDISSEPFQLRFCNEDFQPRINVYRGQTFSLEVVALGQVSSSVPTTVTASVSQDAGLKLGQSSVAIPGSCSNMTFNMYSTTDYGTLTIYPAGPCKIIGQASTVVNVTFLPCPDAFEKSREKCVCERRLKQLNATCVIEDEVTIWRYAGANFWINASYHVNGSYKGLIISSSCPAEYCAAETVAMSLSSPDRQCAFNRSGVLCGSCGVGLSLLLGGSRCGECSNAYLLLLSLFALAGVVLVVFLSFSRLTVATGSINSLILYANIVQVNKEVFFPSSRTNVLTVFIAWMNLDLGFETCFFDGMDVYVRTWLQFVFSVYVWSLILVIILASRYSLTVSKLIGSNPVAVLATLILMSYNKILKVIIDVFSSVNLEFPDGEKVSVWLKDGNLPFLHSKHLYLSIFTLLVLILIFLPYTIFLLIGHFLYLLPPSKYYDWLIIKIKPLLDSYYAPYKLKSRYWTGFLLFIRCGLYTAFSFNSLGGTKYSLLAVVVTFTAVGMTTSLHNGIYQHFYIDVIEVSVYVNLIVLSAAATTLPDASREIATFALVGTVLATFVGVTVYQVYQSYLANSALWLRMKQALLCCRQKSEENMQLQGTPEHKKTDLENLVGLREPLIDS